MNVFINSIFGGIQLNYTHFFLKKKKPSIMPSHTEER